MPPKTTTRGDIERRRIDLRLTPAEHARLERSAREHLRSIGHEARHLIVQALCAQQPEGRRGAE